MFMILIRFQIEEVIILSMYNTSHIHIFLHYAMDKVLL